MLNSDNQEPKNIQSTAVRALASEDLFEGARELVIKHAGEEYHLRLTNQGKLILTK